MAQNVFAVTETDLCTSHVGDEGSGIRACFSEIRPSPSQLRYETLGVRRQVAKDSRSVGNTKGCMLRNWLVEWMMAPDGPLNLAKREEHHLC